MARSTPQPTSVGARSRVGVRTIIRARSASANIRVRSASEGSAVGASNRVWSVLAPRALTVRRVISVGVLVACGLMGTTSAYAELAKLRLTDGTELRADATLARTQVVIHTPVGDQRYPRERVERIEWLEPVGSVESDYMRRFYAIEPDDADGHFKLCKWLVDQRRPDLARQQCEYVLTLAPGHAGAAALLRVVNGEEAAGAATRPVATQPAAKHPAGDAQAPARAKGVATPAPLSKHDIRNLKLSEMKLDGPAERVVVRFVKERGERDVIELVREEMIDADDFDPDWERTIDRGQLHEKLQIVLKATGLKYADRIDLRSSPAVFTTYRRRVLPLVNRGCIRSGCHGGGAARVFRFPDGSRTGDEYVYTSFAILDRLTTPIGPMLDRGRPEQSALPRYMLPAEAGRELHPPVAGRKISAILRGTRDPRYKSIIEWIDSLRTPHPDYQLEYEWPKWLAPDADAREPGDDSD